MQVEDLGLGQQIIFNPEVSTFSDNVVLSSPISGVKYQNIGREVVEPVSSFFRQLVQLLISIYWQGLHLGLLFRGAITTGRLYHDANIVAGEGLVKAVQMEKTTRWPRIEVDKEIFSSVDENGSPIADALVVESAVLEEDGRYFLNTFGFHIGVWWDYNHFNGKKECSWVEVKEVINNIKKHALFCIQTLEDQKKGSKNRELQQILEAQKKWEWFLAEFEKGQSNEDWQRIWVANNNEQ